MAKGLTFKTRTDAFNAIRLAAGHHEDAKKQTMIAAAHKQWPPKAKAKH